MYDETIFCRNQADRQFWKPAGGWRRIRTFEGVSQQIYSLSRLTASVSTHGATVGNRTRDLVLTMDALYQLSYCGIF